MRYRPGGWLPLPAAVESLMLVTRVLTNRIQELLIRPTRRDKVRPDHGDDDDIRALPLPERRVNQSSGFARKWGRQKETALSFPFLSPPLDARNKNNGDHGNETTGFGYACGGQTIISNRRPADDFELRSSTLIGRLKRSCAQTNNIAPASRSWQLNCERRKARRRASRYHR